MLHTSPIIRIAFIALARGKDLAVQRTGDLPGYLADLYDERLDPLLNEVLKAPPRRASLEQTAVGKSAHATVPSARLPSLSAFPRHPFLRSSASATFAALGRRASGQEFTGVRGQSVVGHSAFGAQIAAPQDDAKVDLRKNVDLYKGTIPEGHSGVNDGPAIPLSRPPTLLAPAGGWSQLIAAVNSGADACYFGVRDAFNARARAANFAVEELPEVMAYLREHNVKGYATVNVVIFDSELPAVEELLRALALAGVDALIVQDLSVVKLCRALAPGLPVHASTQMSITSAEGAEFVRELGCERVVVGRELSTKEIRRVVQGTSAEVEAFVHGALCVSYSGQCFSSEAWGGRSANRGQCAQACRLPYGLLVNGTLKELGDVSYLLSPQDLSGLTHVPQLIRAGVHCFKVEGRLKGPEYVTMTTKAYREAIDFAWSQLQKGASDEEATLPATRLLELSMDLGQVFARGQDADHLGLSSGFLDGSKHQDLVRGRSPGHRGLLVGAVLAVDPARGVVTISRKVNGTSSSAAPRVRLKRGDGVVFDSIVSTDGSLREKDEQGGSIYDLRCGDDMFGCDAEEWADGPPELPLELSFGRAPGAAPDFRKVHVGDLVWRNRDAALDRALRGAASRPISATVADAARGSGGEGGAAPPSAAVHVTVRGAFGEPLTVRVKDVDGRAGEGTSSVTLERARSSPLTADAVRAAVCALGGEDLVMLSYDDSKLILEPKIEADGHDAGTGTGLFMPAKAIKETRRTAVAALLNVRRSHTRAEGLANDAVLPSLLSATLQDAAGARWHISNAEVGDAAADVASIPSGLAGSVELTVLCRTPEQVAAALKLDEVKEVAVDFLEVQGLQKAVDATKAAGKRCVVATPRILKPDEERLWKFYLRLGADALLVRSSGLLHKLLGFGGAGAVVQESGRAGGLRVPELHGDFSLNAVNMISAGSFLASGLARLTVGHDLSGRQIAELATALGPQMAARLEVVIHQHLPVFHTEHCVFCRFLSQGDNYTNCGHPCETSQVHLRDSAGRDHLVLADMGCRNTVFNAQAQSAVNLMPRLLKAGVRQFRVELVDEPSDVVGPLLNAYRRVTVEPGHARDAWRWLQTVPDANGNAQGVTLGSLQDKAEIARDDLKLTKTRAKERQQQQFSTPPRMPSRPKRQEPQTQRRPARGGERIFRRNATV